MKRLLATILTILYMATTVGATVRVHYCMGRLADISLAGDKTCSKCGKEKPAQKSCCRDEYHVIKNSHQHISSTISADVATLHATDVLPLIYQPAIEQYIPVAAHKSFTATSPPHQLRSCPIYISVCNWRI